MSRPPIKAMEAVKRYCSKHECGGCPLKGNPFQLDWCQLRPCYWKTLKREGEHNEQASN